MAQSSLETHMVSGLPMVFEEDHLARVRTLQQEIDRLARALTEECSNSLRLARELGPKREALEYMASEENWSGNPASHDAVLLGHDTPFELARAALAVSGSSEPR